MGGLRAEGIVGGNGLLVEVEIFGVVVGVLVDLLIRWYEEAFR